AKARGAGPRRGASLAHFDRDVAETRVGRAVTDAHELKRFALGAREEAVQLPVVGDEIAAAPKVRRERLEGDAARVPLELPFADDSGGLRREMEVLPFVVERIRGRRLHEEAGVDAA